MINKKLVETPVKMMNRMEEITDLICEYNDEVQKQQEENTRLQHRIDKAIEYINKHCVNEKVSKEIGFKCYTMADTNELEHIMILLGSYKE